MSKNLESRVDAADIVSIVNRHPEAHGALIAVLEEVQEKYGYLPEEALRVVARSTNRSLVDVYGVATFYRSFSLHPRGKHHICACLGTACHVRGAPRIVDELERQLHVRAGETTPDGEYTLETVSCLGACALGPIVVADKVYYSNVDAAGVKKLLKKTSEATPAAGLEPERTNAAADRGGAEMRLTASNV